jgi:glycosyltransferase involved in cell wall biosynthesis
MASEARRSSLFSDVQVEVIPYGINCTDFRPRDTEGVSTALGIPPNHKIVLFLASSTERTRKGFDLFAEAVEAIRGENVSFISVGGGEPELAEHVDHVHLGTVESDVLLSVLYSVADLFVIPSRQDNLPNTVLESMACGTPVIGFETGGIPDMVRPNETGWLVEKENVRQLRQAIQTGLIDDDGRRQKGKTCRNVVEGEYALDVQASAYRSVYDDMLQHRSEETESSPGLSRGNG